MSIKKRYKSVTIKMTLLQISNYAIPEPIITAMKPYIQFKDVYTEINDTIYSGSVFKEIIEDLSNELSNELTQPSIPLKFIPELKKLNKLAKKYNYLMVIE